MKRVLTVALFVFILAVPSAFPFGQNKIVYDDFKWNVYHSTHFDFYFYDQERGALQKVVDSSETAYANLSTKFDYQISKKIPLIFYHTHSAFEQTNVDLNFIPEGVGAFAEPALNRMVLPIDMSDDRLLQLITHELTHILDDDHEVRSEAAFSVSGGHRRRIQQTPHLRRAHRPRVCSLGRLSVEESEAIRSQIRTSIPER